MRLYRYRPFNPDFLEAEIVREQIYSWHLDDQSDPFEGRFVLEKNVSREAIYSFFLLMREDLRKGKYPADRDTSWLHGHQTEAFLHAERFFASATDAELADHAKAAFDSKHFEKPETIQQIIDKSCAMTHRVVITCFSSVKDSPTMLSYYSAGHTGVVIEYEVAVGLTQQVQYVSELPKIPLLFTRADSLVEKRLLTKHCDWQYEREHRLFIYDRPPGLHDRPGIQIVSVAAGCRMNQRDQKQLLRMVNASQRRDIAAWRLAPIEDSYALTRFPLDA